MGCTSVVTNQDEEKKSNINKSPIKKEENFAIPNNKTEQKNLSDNDLPPTPPVFEDQNRENNEQEIANNKRDKESSNETNINNNYPNFEENTHQKAQNSAMKENIKKMYDIIFVCESIDKLIHGEGWEYYYSDRYKKLIKEKKEEKYSKIGFIGETNKGKTFILNQLTKNQLDSGEQYKTEGLSCKFTDFEGNGNKFMIFDTAGRSEPLLIDESNNRDKPNISNDEKLKELKKEVENKSRDLKLSEKFLRNFIINNSDIIILVVNQLTLSEQKSLYQLKTENNFDEIFILHNLCNFYKRKDIEDYVENTIINSLYFDLRKNYFQSKNKNEDTIDMPYYFVEEQNETNNTKSLVCHLITGNVETKDEWVKNLNEKTFEHLKNEIQVNCRYKGNFVVIKDLLSKELQNQDIINKDDKHKVFEEEEPLKDPNDKFNTIYNNNGILKLSKDLRKEFDENDNFIGFNNGFIPPYIYYKQDKKFIIEVECAGEFDKEMTIEAKKRKQNIIFKIKGKKIYPYNIKKDPLPFDFSFQINVEKEKIKIETENNKSPTFENGIYKKEFPILDLEKQAFEIEE